MNPLGILQLKQGFSFFAGKLSKKKRKKLFVKAE